MTNCLCSAIMFLMKTTTGWVVEANGTTTRAMTKGRAERIARWLRTGKGGAAKVKAKVKKAA